MKKRHIILLGLIGLLTVTGCVHKDTAEVTDELVWYPRINKQPSNDEVFAKAEQMVRDKLGIGLDIIVLEDYSTQIQLTMASGEDYDIVYTSSTINSYNKNVSDGNLLALDVLLPEYAPKLYAAFDREIWDALRVQGKIYGVFNQQIAARAPCVYVPKQNLNLLDLDWSKYDSCGWAEYEEYLRKIKEITGSFTYVEDFWGAGGCQMVGIEQVSGSNLPGAIYVNAENPQIINQYETQEYRDYIALRSRWVAEGLTSSTRVAENNLIRFADYESDKIIPWLGFCNTYMPGGELEYKNNFGVDVVFLSRSEPILNSFSLTSTMSAVSSKTRYPEKSVEFLEMLHTDKDFYNLIAFGIEDVHYKKVGAERIEKLSEPAYTQPTWAIGNMFNAYLIEGQADDIWKQTEKINTEAVRSPILGFAPDLDNVTLEVTRCNAVLEEYLNILNEGLMDDTELYGVFMEKLKGAGCDKIISELNMQLAEWRNAQLRLW